MLCLLALCGLALIGGCTKKPEGLHEAGLKGSVTDATSGTPISKAEVYFYNEESAPSEEEFTAVEPYKKAITDENGRYKIANIFLGNSDSATFLMGVKTLDGIYKSFDLESVTLREGHWNERDIAIDSANGKEFRVKTGQLTGVVTDCKSGKKLSGVKVWLLGYRDDDTRYQSSVYTDDYGRYKLFVPYRRFNRFQIAASLAGYVYYFTSNVTLSKDIVNVNDICLSRPMGKIIGAVSDKETGKRLGKVKVSLYGAREAGKPIDELIKYVFTNYVNNKYFGEYEIIDIPIYEYVAFGIAAEVDDYQSTEVEEVQFPNNGTSKYHDIRMVKVKAKGSLSGVVTDSESGEKLANATVSLYSGTKLFSQTLTDNQGRYTVPDIAINGYTTFNIRVELAGYEAQEVKEVAIAANCETKRDIQLTRVKAAIFGTVRLEPSNVLLAGEKLFLYGAKEVGKATDELIASTISDGQGCYTFDNIPIKDYVAFGVGAEENQSLFAPYGIEEVQISSGQKVKHDVSMRRTRGEVRGMVQNKDRDALKEAKVSLYGAREVGKPIDELIGNVRTKYDGEYSMYVFSVDNYAAFAIEVEQFGYNMPTGPKTVYISKGDIIKLNITMVDAVNFPQLVRQGNEVVARVQVKGKLQPTHFGFSYGGRDPNYNIEIPASEVKSKSLSNRTIEYTFAFNISENLGTSSDFVLVAWVEDDSNRRVKGSIEFF